MVINGLGLLQQALKFRKTLLNNHVHCRFTDSGAYYMRRAGPLCQAGSVCKDLGTSVKHAKTQVRDYMEKFQPG